MRIECCEGLNGDHVVHLRRLRGFENFVCNSCELVFSMAMIREKYETVSYVQYYLATSILLS